jgi:hypothetical protein
MLTCEIPPTSGKIVFDGRVVIAGLAELRGNVKLDLFRRLDNIPGLNEPE